MASERLHRQINRLLDEAERAIPQRDWTSVRARARDVPEVDPNSQESREYLAAA